MPICSEDLETVLIGSINGGAAVSIAIVVEAFMKHLGFKPEMEIKRVMVS